MAFPSSLTTSGMDFVWSSGSACPPRHAGLRPWEWQRGQTRSPTGDRVRGTARSCSARSCVSRSWEAVRIHLGHPGNGKTGSGVSWCPPPTPGLSLCCRIHPGPGSLLCLIDAAFRFSGNNQHQHNMTVTEFSAPMLPPPPRARPRCPRLRPLPVVAANPASQCLFMEDQVLITLCSQLKPARVI